MPTQSTVIARDVGNAEQITAWQNDWNTARDNGYMFVFGCGVGTKLVAVLEKPNMMLKDAMRKTKPKKKSKPKPKGKPKRK